MVRGKSRGIGLGTLKDKDKDKDNVKIENATIMGKSDKSDTTTDIESNVDRLDETRELAEAKEEEGATDTSFKETAGDKALEEQSGTPGQASKQFQAISDAEKNLYEKPLTSAGRPHPVAKEGEKQL